MTMRKMRDIENDIKQQGFAETGLSSACWSTKYRHMVVFAEYTDGIYRWHEFAGQIADKRPLSQFPLLESR